VPGHRPGPSRQVRAPTRRRTPGSLAPESIAA
jgi:hypothetical protein